MKNKDKWLPSKYVHRRGRLMASRNPAEVMFGSRLMADIVAAHYDKHIPQHAKGRLIDLGCGKVPLFEAYRDYIVENVCVDWHYSMHLNEYLDYTCDLNEQLPFRDGEFDTIILSDVLEHVAEPGHLWREMSRILKTNGKLLANVPFFYWLHEQPHDYYRFTEHALRRFANLSGFQLLVLEPVGGAPEVIADILAKHMQALPLAGDWLALAFQRATQAFVSSTLGEKVSRKTNGSFPLGYFLVGENYKGGTSYER